VEGGRGVDEETNQVENLDRKSSQRIIPFLPLLDVLPDGDLLDERFLLLLGLLLDGALGRRWSGDRLSFEAGIVLLLFVLLLFFFVLVVLVSILPLERFPSSG